MGARCNPAENSKEYTEYKNRELEESKIRTQEAKSRLEALILEQFQKDADDLLSGSDGIY